MSITFKPFLVPFLIGFAISSAAAQAAQQKDPSPRAVKTAPAAAAAQQKDSAAPPAKSTAAPAELNGYKLAVWGMTKDEVKAALNSDFANAEANNSVSELPWELLHLANIADSDPDDLLGAGLEWYYGDRQDAMLGFYRKKFFFYASALDKVLPVSEYQQALADRHGKASRRIAYQTNDPANPKTALGSFNIELWEQKKTAIVLAAQTQYPGEEPEVNYEISYFSREIFAEFKADFARALAERNEAEKKRSEEQLQEQKRNALDVLQ